MYVIVTIRGAEEGLESPAGKHQPGIFLASKYKSSVLEGFQNAVLTQRTFRNAITRVRAYARRSLCYAQPANLKLAIRVAQLKLPLAGRYSLVYQKVQSSTGSICIAL